MSTADDKSGLEIVVGDNKGAATLDFMDGKAGTVKSSEVSGAGLDFEADGKVSRTGLGKGAAEAEPEDDLEDEDLGDGDKKEEPAADDKAEEEETAEGEGDDLGEFDPDNEEVVSKFDAKFTTEVEGGGVEINSAAFSAEVDVDLKAGGTGALKPATYEYLKARFGVSKDYADSLIKGQLALRAQNEDAFYAKVGGAETYAKKLEWAKTGYTPAQKARFNAAVAAGGEEAADALDLLNAKYAAATSKGTEEGGDGKDVGKRPGIGIRRPASPKKSTTTSANPGGGTDLKPFADAEEHRKAQAEALKSGDKAKLDLVRKRLVKSTFWK